MDNPAATGAHIGRMADPSRARCDVREQCLMVDTIELEATSAEASMPNAVEFIRACRDRRSEYAGRRGGLTCHPLAEAEKLSTARPTPPFHGSNPAWMLVRYQELVIAPRARTSLMKSSTLNDHEVIGDGAT